MKTDTIAALERFFAEFPRAGGEAVLRHEILDAAAELGRQFPLDYCEFVEKYGGAEVGPYPIYGLRKALSMGNAYSVVEVTREFRRWAVPGTQDWLIVSEDHAGNPVGIAGDGKVYIWDHDYRQTLLIGESFEDYLRKECLDLKD